MNRLLDLTKEPDEGAPFSKNLSPLKGVFLGGHSSKSFDGLKDPVNWVYEYNPLIGKLTLQREDGKSEIITIFEDKKGLDFISVVWDRQMQLVLTYVIGSTSYIYYWDALEDKYVEKDMEGTYIKATLISHYTLHSSFSQVVVGYVKNDKELCIRLQQDRYSREYLVKKFENKIKLYSISYTNKNRFQYEVMEAVG